MNTLIPTATYLTNSYSTESTNKRPSRFAYQGTDQGACAQVLLFLPSVLNSRRTSVTGRSLRQRGPSLPIVRPFVRSFRASDLHKGQKRFYCQAQQTRDRMATTTVDMKERMEFLKKDLDNLFNDRGVDQSQYDDQVNFMDPITKYSSVKGYMFNIGMLKTIFAPEFQLHDIKQTGEYEATTRWTMIMKPTFNRKLGLQRFWDPRLIFTGVSIMGVNPENGKFNKHIDLWDAIEPENQEFLSREGVAHVFSQLTASASTPDLDTPQFTILKKKKRYEVRRYEPFVVAETSMGSSSGQSESSTSSPAGEGGSAFNTLAGYLFGGNKDQQKMQMTMPVFTDSAGKMQFVLSSKKDSMQSFPDPDSEAVTTRDEGGGLFAVIVFSGIADEQTSQAKRHELLQTLQSDGVAYDASKWILARYNDPSTKPAKRKNEVLIPLKDFDIWTT